MRSVISWLRFAWATLTSMRTALILLLVLGIAAVPGSLLPQRPTSPVDVAEFLRANPGYGPWLDRLGMFDVFGSAWFAAIYLLLFISLIGCILPRTAGYLREVRALPAPPPGRLTRLPGHTSAVLQTDPVAVLDAAEAHLRSRRYRVRRDATSISAERGYLRETGNLVFHICLVTMLIGLAWGSLFQFRGTSIVVEGQAFSNTLTQYDDFGAGAGFDSSQLSPFTLRLNSFEVRFENGPVQTGAARDFDADVTLSRPGQDDLTAGLQVNQPLLVDGDSVHLLGHGYAPVVTVRDGNGDIAFSGPVVFLPQDENFRSEGVVKAPDARPERLAFQGVFLPTAVSGGASGMVSAFPDVLNPELLVNVWSGPPKVETGAPENVYALDPEGLTQLMDGDQPVSVALTPGTGYKLPDGKGSISFDGWRRWVKVQVSNTPGGWLVLGSVMLAVAGMALSLTVKPRRLYVRVGVGGVPGPGARQEPEPTGSMATDAAAGGPGGPARAEDPERSDHPVSDDRGTTVAPDAGSAGAPVGSTGLAVSVAGLDRVEGRGGLEQEVADLAAACGIRATLAPTEDEGER